MTQSECSATSCISATTCRECTETRSGCLWCPSLNHCVHESLYPYTYIYGQCLGWVSQSFNCSGNCSDYKTCSDCQNDPYCGWCNDPSDTGLGECTEGGFISPKNSSICMDYSDEETYGRWFFDICPGMFFSIHCYNNCIGLLTTAVKTVKSDHCKSSLQVISTSILFISYPVNAVHF